MVHMIVMIMMMTMMWPGGEAKDSGRQDGHDARGQQGRRRDG